MTKRKLLKYLIEHTTTFLKDKGSNNYELTIKVKDQAIIDELRKQFR